MFKRADISLGIISLGIISLGIIAFIACNSDRVTAPAGPLTGVFVLRTINGAPLPAPGNGTGLTAFTMLADTVRVFADGFGDEVQVTSRPDVAGVNKQDMLLQVWDRSHGNFDVEYPCPDYFATATASCIAPPHHRGVQSSGGMTFTYSVLYRVPLVYERVGDYIRPTLNRTR